MLPFNAANRVLQSLLVGALLVCLISLFVDRVRPQDSSSSSSTGLGVAQSSSGLQPISSSSTGYSLMSSSSSAVPRFLRNNTANQIFPADEPNSTITYCNTAMQGPLNSYDNTTICLIIGGVAKIYFYPRVEDYSLLQVVANGNFTGSFDHPAMWFQAEFSGRASTIKHRRPQRKENNAFYVPFWTLVITLTDGLVTNLEWDDGCFSCSDDQCVDSTCALDATNCYSTDRGSTDCAPKIFVGWFGTDRSGVYLTSAGSRLSRFRSYSVTSAYNSAAQTADLQFNDVSDRYTFKPTCGTGTAACCDGTECDNP